MQHFQSKRKKPNPSLKTNIFLSLFFTHTRHILKKGVQKELTEDDLYEVLPTFRSGKLGDELESQWDKLTKSKKPSIPRLLFRVYGKEFLLIILSLVIPITEGIFQQKAMKNLILSFTTQDGTGWYHAALLIFLLCLHVLYSENFYFRIEIFALKMRTGFISLIYRKVLEMKEPDKVSIGKVIDLVTRDVSEFTFSFYVIISAIKDIAVVVMICYVLYVEVGWLFLIMVAAVCLIMLPDVCTLSLIKSIKANSFKSSDERYHHTKEILNSIRLVKLYLWIDKFNEKIYQLKKKEIFFTTKFHYLKEFKQIFAEFVMKFVWYSLMVASIYFDLQLGAGTLFLIINSVTSLRRATKESLSVVFHKMAALITAYERIGNFLRSVNNSVESSHKNNLNKPIFKTTGSITTISGPLGSGKSTLLKTIAKDFLEKSSTVSYASQEPWLFPSTIRQNILFGAEYDEKRYFKVLRVCALSYDFESLKERDKTLLLDRGVNLSKGQQVRINLARAVYKNSDVYLLDDCLSSLDVFVADFIFKECVRGFLKDKIVVIVTQEMRYVRAANSVISCEDGKVDCKAQPCKNVTANEVLKQDEEKSEENCDESISLLTKELEQKIYAEKKALGKVKFDIYKKYVLFGGTCIFFLVVFMRFVSQFLKSTVNKFESQWINVEQIIFDNVTDGVKNEALERRQKMIYLLPILLTLAVLLHVLMTRVYWKFASDASVNLHQKLLEKVTNATMKFFDKHLVGTVLNRFSEDLLVIDDNIPYEVTYLINCFLELLGIIFVIAVVNAVFLVPCFLLSFLLLVARMLYLRPGSALRRLEFALRSPLIGHLGATFDGLTTIETSQNHQLVCEEFDRHLDTYTSCSYISATTKATFYLFVDTLGICFFCFILVYFLVLDKSTSSADVGLVLTQTLLFVVIQQLTIFTCIIFDKNMTTVERVMEYTKQEQESKSGLVIEEWPLRGEIQFENASFAYDDHRVFTNLNFGVKSKEKVAVIGRTGSGKTSLLYTLMRLYKFEGKITIDGVDINTLQVDFLRSKISLVPQDPILFTGSLRDNIDPTGQYTDDEIWKTIRTVKLTVFQSLDDKISGDSQLSVGQKQLISLCRALIRKNKIVIIDELTANVDDDVETMMYDIIEEHFVDCTVIMITHKLRYALNFDKILVLDQGRIIESGIPSFLLQDKNGTFCRMYTEYNS